MTPECTGTFSSTTVVADDGALSGVDRSRASAPPWRESPRPTWGKAPSVAPDRLPPGVQSVRGLSTVPPRVGVDDAAHAWIIVTPP